MRELDCPNCGAHFQDYKPGAQINCGYCGTSFLAPANPAPTPTSPGVQIHIGGVPTLDPAQVEAASRGARRLGCAIAGFVLVLVGGIGFTVYSVISKVVPNMPGMPDMPDLPELPKLGGQAAQMLGQIGSERFGWDDVGGSPIPVEIGGKPAVLGRTRDHSNDGALYVDAYRSENGERLWRIGPLSDYSNAYKNVQFDVLDDTVVVSDVDGVLHLHGLADGKERTTVKLRERVVDMCTPRDAQAERKVWIGMADEADLLLDPSSATTQPAPTRPQWCTASRQGTRWGSKRQMMAERKGKKGGPKLPKLQGTDFEDYAVGGELGVARGTKRPGTAIPRVAGFDPATGEVRWNSDIPSIDLGSVRPDSTEAGALAGDAYVTVYGEGTEDWRVTAFDALSGTRLWDESMRPIFAVDRITEIVGGADYAYLVRTGALEIRDLKDGKLTGTIGTVTYDE